MSSATLRSDIQVMSLVSVAHALSHFLQLNIAPLFPLLKDELDVSYAALGLTTGIFYAVSGVFQTVSGFAVDRFGARRVLTGGLFLCVLGALIAGTAGSYNGLIVAALVGGLGNSVFHPSDFAIMNGRIDPTRLGYAFSSHSIAGNLGYAITPIFSVAVAAIWGWQAAILAGAAIGAVVVAAALLFGQLLDVPAVHAAQQTTLSASQRLRDDVRRLFSVPVLMCFAYFVFIGVVFIAIQTFGVSAMTTVYGISAALASSVLTAYMFGGSAGILTGGYVAAKGFRPDRVAASGMLIGALVMLLAGLAWLPGSALPALFAMAGFASGVTQPSRDLLVRQTTPPGSTGSVYGFVYSGLDLGSILAPVYFGWLMDLRLAQWVFFSAVIVMLVTIMTVLRLPARRPSIA